MLCNPVVIGKFGGEVLRECSKTVSDFLPRAKRPKGSVFLPEEVHEKGHESFSLVPKKARDQRGEKGHEIFQHPRTFTTHVAHSSVRNVMTVAKSIVHGLVAVINVINFCLLTWRAWQCSNGTKLSL